MLQNLKSQTANAKFDMIVDNKCDDDWIRYYETMTLRHHVGRMFLDKINNCLQHDISFKERDYIIDLIKFNLKDYDNCQDIFNRIILICKLKHQKLSSPSEDQVWSPYYSDYQSSFKIKEGETYVQVPNYYDRKFHLNCSFCFVNCVCFFTALVFHTTYKPEIITTIEGQDFVLPLMLGNLKSTQAEKHLGVILTSGDKNDGYYFASMLKYHVDRLVLDNIKKHLKACIESFDLYKTTQIIIYVQCELDQYDQCMEFLDPFINFGCGDTPKDPDYTDYQEE